ncbi:MAG: YcxB family protein [Lautropia sp.]
MAIVIWFAGAPPAFAAVAIGAGIGGAIGHWIWDRKLVPARAAKLYRQNGDFAVPMHITWNASGVEIRSEKGSWRRSWTEFVKRRESETMTLLYINDQIFNIFPRNLYGNDDEWQSFREAASRVPI